MHRLRLRPCSFRCRCRRPGFCPHLCSPSAHDVAHHPTCPEGWDLRGFTDGAHGRAAPRRQRHARCQCRCPGFASMSFHPHTNNCVQTTPGIVCFCDAQCRAGASEGRWCCRRRKFDRRKGMRTQQNVLWHTLALPSMHHHWKLLQTHQSACKRTKCAAWHLATKDRDREHVRRASQPRR